MANDPLPGSLMEAFPSIFGTGMLHPLSDGRCVDKGWRAIGSTACGCMGFRELLGAESTVVSESRGFIKVLGRGVAGGGPISDGSTALAGGGKGRSEAIALGISPYPSSLAWGWRPQGHEAGMWWCACLRRSCLQSHQTGEVREKELFETRVQMIDGTADNAGTFGIQQLQPTRLTR